MKEKTPLWHKKSTCVLLMPNKGFMLKVFLILELVRSQFNRVKKLLLYQKEPFLTMFYTINSSLLIVTIIMFYANNCLN